jgi:class 3 adenylate cyclase
MEPQIRFCTSADGTRIAYATIGEGPPLVFLPGWMSTIERNLDFLNPLAQGRSLVTFDRRGTGASQRDVDGVSLETEVADVVAVVDCLELKKFDLLGVGESTAVGVAYAAQYPDRVSRLVLLHSYPCGEVIIKPEEARTLVELIRGNWSLARRTLAAIIVPDGPIERQRFYSNSLRESLSSDVAAKHVEFYASVDVRPYLSQVKTPTLVLHPRRDRMTSISAGRQVAASIPDARFIALEGATLWLPEDVETMRGPIHEFLSEGEESVPGTNPLAAEDIHTILFTDVEGSTALTDRLGDAKARELLREHERIVREALKAHGGSEVKTMGDGFMASFGSATQALECAIAIQSAFAERNESAEEPIKVRIGLNAGEPIAEDDPGGRGDLFGTAVNMAARIAAKAEGGEILVADVVRQLVAGKEFLFNDRGDAELRGFEDPVRVYEVRWREQG